MNEFSSFPLREELTRAVSELGYVTPTPIQQKALPLLLSKATDIIALAQTGTGKTAAFGLPLLHHMDPAQHAVQALVLSPTRELCMQIQEDFKKFGVHMRGLRTTAVYGGVPISGQIRELRGNPQVVVATPGRLMDLMERKAISLEEVRYVVLDEADEMLNMGFRDDIDMILKHTPSREQTWLFSATMNQEVRGIAKRFMKQWEEISVSPANSTNENIEHQYYVTRTHNRFDTLQRLLDFTPGIYGIIFTRTKQDCQEIAEKLMRQGYLVSPLHGDMDQKMRSKVMDRFKQRTLQAIVATDVAARGIDVNDITHVINYELPDDPEVYTHRSGRTARAGKSGICMSIVTPREIGSIRSIERIVKSRFNRCEIPDGNEILRKRFLFNLAVLETADPADNGVFDAFYEQEVVPRMAETDPQELVKKLFWLQMKETLETYRNATDLNAGQEAESRQRAGGGGQGWVRLYINLGSKEGFNPDKMLRFIADMTDIQPQQIDRVMVREVSSFFNVQGEDLKDFIVQVLGAKKFKGRRIRVEEAEQRKRPAQGGGGYAGRSSEDRFNRASGFGERKFNKRY